MFEKNRKPREGLIKGIALAYTILILHLTLIAGLGLVVIFLTGLAGYLSLIVFCGIAVIALSGYLFYRRLKREGRTLGDVLQAPDLKGRELEISLLGGLATIRLGNADSRKAIEAGSIAQPPLLEDSESARIKEIEALARLLEKDLITQDEFDQAKRRLLNA